VTSQLKYLDSFERENLFERILEEADEMESEDEHVEDLVGPGSSPSPETVRRPSAKLPSNYHSTLPPTNTFAGKFQKMNSKINVKLQLHVFFCCSYTCSFVAVTRVLLLQLCSFDAVTRVLLMQLHVFFCFSTCKIIN